MTPRAAASLFAGVGVFILCTALAASIFASVMSTTKKTLGRLLILVVSMGYGVVKCAMALCLPACSDLLTEQPLPTDLRLEPLPIVWYCLAECTSCVVRKSLAPLLIESHSQIGFRALCSDDARGRGLGRAYPRAFGPCPVRAFYSTSG